MPLTFLLKDFTKEKRPTKTPKEQSLEFLQGKWISVAQGGDFGRHFSALPRSPSSVLKHSFSQLPGVSAKESHLFQCHVPFPE